MVRDPIEPSKRSQPEPPAAAARRTAFRRLFEAGADAHFTLELRADGGTAVVDADVDETLRTLLSTEVVRRAACEAVHVGSPTTFRTGPLPALDGREAELRFVPHPAAGEAARSLVTGAARLLPARVPVDPEPADDVFYQAFHRGPTALSVTRLEDGVLVDVNDRYATITGYARDELVGRRAADLGLWSDMDAHDAVVQRLLSGDAIADEEFSLRRRDGVLRAVLGTLQLLSVRGEPCILSNLIDVTAERAAAAADRESRALLEKVFHASPAGMMLHHLDDGQVLGVNRAWTALTGFAAEDARGAAVWSLPVWKDDAHLAVFRERLRSRDTLHEVELSLRRRDGEAVTVLASTQHLSVQGRASVLTVLSDITSRKRSEVELRDAKEEAEHSVRMKNAFLTNMTHEVRTPLTVILGFTSMLRQGVRPEYRRFVRVVERSGRRLLLMLDSILDLAHLEAGALEVLPESVNIVSAVEHVTGEVRPLAEEKELTLRVDLPDAPLYAYVDHRLLLRVLTHVLDNAIKFTDEGEVSVSLEADADVVRVRVRDTGVGIDAAFLPHVFEEFAQESTGLERTHQGSGLGLTVAQRLVALLGGKIVAESAKGQGSLFVITLPRDADA